MRPTHHRPRFRLTVAVIGLLLVVAWSSPAGGLGTSTWSMNLFSRDAVVFQDPYPNACTAATAMTILNTIAIRHAGGAGFRWKVYREKDSPNPAQVRDLTSVLAFARSHDTLSLRGTGSDSHGWRNAINYYGWGLGAMQDPARRVYETLTYRSYDAAIHAAIRAIARFGMPVGIASRAGSHAQVLTGYVVDGANPAVSDAFTVRFVFLTDPLYLQQHVNDRVSNATLKGGTYGLRFAAYREADSPYDDPYAAGWERSAVSPRVAPSQWYGRWVIVAPIRVPASTPTPTPSPTPAESPTEAPTDPAGPSFPPTSTPTETPTPTPTVTPTEPPTDPPGPSIPPTTAPTDEPPASATVP